MVLIFLVGLTKKRVVFYHLWISVENIGISYVTIVISIAVSLDNVVVIDSGHYYLVYNLNGEIILRIEEKI